MTSTWLVILSLAIALGAPVAYALLLRVPVVRNHPEGYVVAFAVAAMLAGLAVGRAPPPRRPRAGLDGPPPHEPLTDRRRVVQLRWRTGAAHADGAPGGRAGARLHADRCGRPARIAGRLPRAEAGRADLLPRLLVTV